MKKLLMFDFRVATIATVFGQTKLHPCNRGAIVRQCLWGNQDPLPKHFKLTLTSMYTKSQNIIKLHAILYHLHKDTVRVDCRQQCQQIGVFSQPIQHVINQTYLEMVYGVKDLLNNVYYTYLIQELQKYIQLFSSL